MADSNLKFRQTTSGAHGSAGRADCLLRGKPPACIGVRQLCRKKIRCWGAWCVDYGGGVSPTSVPEGFQRASGKPFGEPAGAYPLPRVGYDAPTTARKWDLPSYGALTLFFRWRKKSVQKKASGTATPGKRLLLPILMAGLAMSRAMKLDSFHKLLERARARLFPPSKWAGLFPSAAYRRSAPPQLA